MTSLFSKTIYQVFIFTLACILLNMFFIPVSDTVTPLMGFIILYLFWLFLIILSYLVSRSMMHTNKIPDEDGNV